MNTRAESSSRLSEVGAENYRDNKRHAWLFYPLWMLTPIISIGLGHATGFTGWYWLTPVSLFMIMPVLDQVIGSNSANAPEGAVPKLEEDHYYRYLAYTSVTLHYLALLVGAWVVATQPLGWLAYAGITLSCGLISAFGIVTAHELGHKKSKFERWLAKIVLATGCYGQYMVDHNRGHHRDVATPGDSGSARFGENFWYYMLARQLPHSTVLRPWNLEKERLARKGKGPWSFENEVIQPMLISLAVYSTLILILGAIVVPYLFAVALTSYFFLAFIDYIEHYGLLREQQADGRYARVRPEHSWNTDHMATNILYLHAQRHSDHHAFPTRRYQVLRSFPNLPTMPTGYPGMFWLTIIPPLWRAVMYPRVLELMDHDLNRINVDPRSRAELFRKYSRVPDKSLRGAAFCSESKRLEHSDAKVSGSAGVSGVFQCTGCGYTYREIKGDLSQGFPPGTVWEKIPATWSCPDCAVRDKVDFVELPERSVPPHSDPANGSGPINRAEQNGH